jgi:hypothetical protein
VEVTTAKSSDNATSASPIIESSTDAGTNMTQTNSSSKPEATEDDYDNISNENEKDETENIQDNADQQQEDELEENFLKKNGSDKATINLFEDPVTNEPALHSGHFALIFASTLIIFSVIAYVGLVLWRAKLERRYGMRQRLVTEDDYYNNNDVRYFGL